MLIWRPETVIVLTSSITVILLYLDLPINFIWPVVLVVLLVLFGFIRAVSFAKLKESPALRAIAVFISALLVQLVAFSTGGVYSPFLALLHIYSLVIGLFMGQSVALLFLSLSLLTLIVNTWINRDLFILIQEDPWTPILYLVSFLALVPLLSIITRSYQLKDKIVTLLTREVGMGRLREEALLSSLRELIVVVNRDFSVESVNEAFFELVNLPEPEVIQKPYFQVIPLLSKEGQKIGPDSLPLSEAFKNKTTHFVSDFKLRVGQDRENIPVDIQVKPILDLEGKANQVMLIILDKRNLTKETQFHTHLEEARMTHNMAQKEFKRMLDESGSEKIKLQAELLAKADQDILNAIELEHHQLKADQSLVDIDVICKKVVRLQKEFASSLGINLKYVELNSPKEQNDKGQVQPKDKTILPDYKIPQAICLMASNEKWLTVLLQKILDIAILLSAEKQGANVIIKLNCEQGILISVKTAFRRLNHQEEDLLFSSKPERFIGRTHLNMGSHLEGFVVSRLAKQLNVSVSTNKYNRDQQTLVFEIKLK